MTMMPGKCPGEKPDDCITFDFRGKACQALEAEPDCCCQVAMVHLTFATDGPRMH